MTDDFKNPLVGQIWEKVSAAFWQRTDDSLYCKSLLPEEITDQFFLLSQAFTALIFSPPLDPSEVRKTHIPPFFLFLMSVGKEVYLAQRSIETMGKPYVIKTDPKEIEKIRSQCMDFSFPKVKISKAEQEVIDEILAKINKDQKKREEEFKVAGRRLRAGKLQNFTHDSLYFGYVFTQKMIEG